MADNLESYVVPVEDLPLIKKGWEGVLGRKQKFIDENILGDLKRIKQLQESTPEEEAEESLGIAAVKESRLRDDIPFMLTQDAYHRMQEFLGQMRTLCLFEGMPIQVKPALFHDAVAIIAAMMTENAFIIKRKTLLLKSDRIEQTYRRNMGFRDDVGLSDQCEEEIKRQKQEIRKDIKNARTENAHLSAFREDIIITAKHAGIKMYKSKVSPGPDGNWQPQI